MALTVGAVGTAPVVEVAVGVGGGSVVPANVASSYSSVLPGVIGTIQSVETIKLILGLGAYGSLSVAGFEFIDLTVTGAATWTPNAAVTMLLLDCIKKGIC